MFWSILGELGDKTCQTYKENGKNGMATWTLAWYQTKMTCSSQFQALVSQNIFHAAFGQDFMKISVEIMNSCWKTTARRSKTLYFVVFQKHLYNKISKFYQLFKQFNLIAINWHAGFRVLRPFFLTLENKLPTQSHSNPVSVSLKSR